MKQTVFVTLIGLLFGICLAELVNLSLFFINVGLALAACLIIIVFIDKTLFTDFVRVTIIFICGCLIGLIRTYFAYIEVPDPILNNYVGTKQVISAKVVTSIDGRDNSVSFNVQPIVEDDLDSKLSEIPLIHVIADRFTDVAYGDIVRIEGIVDSVLTNSKTYARVGESYIRKGVLYEIVFPEITLLQRGYGSYLKENIVSLNSWIKETITLYVREPSAGFINGILIGEKRGLSREWYDAFTRVGLTHVIVLSGYNLAVIFAWTKIILRRTSFFIQNSFGVLSVILLVLVSGAEAPAVRAGILVLIVALASLLQRQQDAGYFLSLTIFLMLLVNPFYLLYDVSFQLSVAATYGLVYIAPILQKYLSHFPRIVGDVVRDTSSAQLAVLPLQLFYFGTFSWVAIFVNIIVLPIIPVLMILGVLILSTSFLSPVAYFIGTCTSLVSGFVLGIVKSVSDTISPSLFSIGFLTLIFCYTALIILIAKNKTI